MPLMRAEEITYTKVQEFEPERSIAFMSVSALEVHGPPAAEDYQQIADLGKKLSAKIKE